MKGFDSTSYPSQPNNRAKFNNWPSIRKFIKNCILLLLVAAVFLGAPASASENLDIRSIKADFIQEKEIKILNKPLVSRGLFYFREPDSIRWEYTAPNRSVVLFSQGKGRRYTWKREEWAEDPGFRPEIMAMICGEMRGWLSGEARGSDYFKAETMESDPRTILLTPLDKGLAAFIDRIMVKQGAQKGIIREIEVIESSGAATRFIFNRVEINQELPVGLFEVP